MAALPSAIVPHLNNVDCATTSIDCKSPPATSLYSLPSSPLLLVLHKNPSIHLCPHQSHPSCQTHFRWSTLPILVDCCLLLSHWQEALMANPLPLPPFTPYPAPLYSLSCTKTHQATHVPTNPTHPVELVSNCLSPYAG